MPVSVYCQFNSFCVNKKCKECHYRPLEERNLLFTIINKSPEIADFKEDKELFRKVPCAHGLRCFERECPFIHGLNLDGRKILTKKFNKEWKALSMKDKIKKEIEDISTNGMCDWNDLI
jgi:hypothetical protein